VSSPYFHPGERKPPATEWAVRLIPGAGVAGRKKPRSATGMPSFSLTSPVTPSAGAKSIDNAQRSQGLAAWRWPTGENWIQSGLMWIARNLQLWASVAWLWANKEGNEGASHPIAGMRNVLIVGADELGRRIADYMDQHPENGRSVCGFLDDRKVLGASGVLGRISDLAQLARAGFIDEVILAAPHDRETTLRVLQSARRLRLDVKMAPDLFGCEPAQATERIGGVPLISLHNERLPIAGLVLKRGLDIAGAGVALILMAPALILLAILVRLDSPGPVLYSALRAGRKGRPFRCYKFRTMVADADALKESLRGQNERQGPFFKIADDPRITWIGRFLRRYSLDELPQLLNVLKGEMSLVGPRPHPLDDFSAYAIEHMPRLDVTPGITGLWQVTARENPSFQAGVDLDIEYIRSWSLGMDLRILLKTAAVVLRGSGE
jgi:exopolysaccharide biosynthesis polyprenyl glycosylphosphotransferase